RAQRGPDAGVQLLARLLRRGAGRAPPGRAHPGAARLLRRAHLQAGRRGGHVPHGVVGRPHGARGVSQALLPVGVGGDIGTYALLRAFHEEYGTDAIVLSKVATRAMEHSSFVRTLVVPGVDEPDQLVDALLRVADQNPGRTLVLLTNADWYVRAIVE